MYRYELKYICSMAQAEMLKIRLKAFAKQDIHADGQGRYNVCSMYFDDLNNSKYYENENGTDPREKYRVRIYNHQPIMKLELKSKRRDKTQKTVAHITMDDFISLSDSKAPQIHDMSVPLLRRIANDMHTRILRPVVIVEYNRTAYTYPVGNVRITFDTHIASSSAYNQFFNKDKPKRAILPQGHCVMEVKYTHLLPDFIKQTLQTDNLMRTPFSKFYLCRKYNIHGTLV